MIWASNVALVPHLFLIFGLLHLNEFRHISQKMRQGPKFRKLQEAIWLTVIKEIFKVPPHFDLFC